jgi:hypothetical protein
VRLDPAKVRFVAAGIEVGLTSQAGLRLVGKENNIQLLETALVVEGGLLKVGLLGLERLFRAALTEWTTVTVPYARIDKARLIRWPLLRLVGGFLLLVVVGLVGVGAIYGGGQGEAAFLTFAVGLTAGGGVLLWWAKPQYEVRFRAKDGRRRKLRFRIADRRLARQFDDRLRLYRTAAAKLAGGRKP